MPRVLAAPLRRVCSEPQGLSSHSLRKTSAEELYRISGYDIHLVREGLGHCDCCDGKVSSDQQGGCIGPSSLLTVRTRLNLAVQEWRHSAHRLL